ncbi:hypothetical protein [uncultured Shewanella sp.]|uniref:hypothetical protein n=1 Tax=uncultured Shewanella sp. TaxID=173975 RepID=UPI0026367EF4|nr:hypothetical protein [uncultured Shewanella sp.]
MEKSVYSLLLIDKHAAFFKRSGQEWGNETISGESWHLASSSNELLQLITKLNKKINSEYQLEKVSLTLVYDNSFASKIGELASILHEYKCQQWQLLSYPLLAKHAHAEEGYQSHSSLDQSWVLTALLPVLYHRYYQFTDTSLSVEENGRQERVVEHHRSEEQRLSVELNDLKMQVETLKQQVNIQHKLDLEQLLCFLPLFYKEVWTVVNPEQIALLSGNLITKINIKSPYRDPDKSTLLALKKQFLRLSIQQQSNIVDFCLRIEHPLEVRSEMESFLEDA